MARIIIVTTTQLSIGTENTQFITQRATQQNFPVSTNEENEYFTSQSPKTISNSFDELEATGGRVLVGPEGLTPALDVAASTAAPFSTISKRVTSEDAAQRATGASTGPSSGEWQEERRQPPFPTRRQRATLSNVEPSEQRLNTLACTDWAIIHAMSNICRGILWIPALASHEQPPLSTELHPSLHREFQFSGSCVR